MVAVRGVMTVLVALLWAAGTLLSPAGASTSTQRSDRVGTFAGSAPACAAVSPSEDDDNDVATPAPGVRSVVFPSCLACASASRLTSIFDGIGTSGWLAGCPRGPPSVA